MGARLNPLLLALVAGCLFSGDETQGLPCEDDEHCGLGLRCVDGVCGGSADDDDATGAADSGEEAEAGSEEEAAESDPGVCELSDSVCSNDATIDACLDGEMMQISCADICDPQPALGCGDSQSLGHATCVCNSVDPGPCAQEGVIECVGTGGVQLCDGGAWQRYDCDFVCDDGVTNGSIGCQFDAGVGGEVCLCPEATPCTDGALYCASPDTIRVCVGGSWQDQNCDEACAANDLGESVGCVFDPGFDDDTCACVG